MKEIIAKYGWPTVTAVGERGSDAAFLLVQHADADRPFQKKCLVLMKAAAAKGEASKQRVAYLTDRLQVAEGKPQTYGTQFHRVGDRLVPFPLEDPAKIDARRAAMGLKPLAEYKLDIGATD